jgi:hypothetical protein
MDLDGDGGRIRLVYVRGTDVSEIQPVSLFSMSLSTFTCLIYNMESDLPAKMHTSDSEGSRLQSTVFFRSGRPNKRDLADRLNIDVTKLTYLAGHAFATLPQTIARYRVTGIVRKILEEDVPGILAIAATVDRDLIPIFGTGFMPDCQGVVASQRMFDTLHHLNDFTLDNKSSQLASLPLILGGELSAVIGCWGPPILCSVTLLPSGEEGLVARPHDCRNQADLPRPFTYQPIILTSGALLVSSFRLDSGPRWFLFFYENKFFPMQWRDGRLIHVSFGFFCNYPRPMDRVPGRKITLRYADMLGTGAVASAVAPTWDRLDSFIPNYCLYFSIATMWKYWPNGTFRDPQGLPCPTPEVGVDLHVITGAFSMVKKNLLSHIAKSRLDLNDKSDVTWRLFWKAVLSNLSTSGSKWRVKQLLDGRPNAMYELFRTTSELPVPGVV